jgi:outer membrane protein W
VAVLTRSCLLAAVCLAVFGAIAPNARGADDFGRKGAYFGIGASRAMNTFEDTFRDAIPFPEVTVSDTWGLNARGGYRFASWFATELEYEYLDRFGVRAGGVQVATLTTHTITDNAKFILPAGRFQPYLLVGLGVIIPDSNGKSSAIEMKGDQVAATGKLGLGMDFYATRNLTLNLGFEAVVNDARIKTTTFGFVDDDGHGLNYVTMQLGFGYRF